jgi:NhaP-type Na+/H+ and K+/H+ antiporter
MVEKDPQSYTFIAYVWVVLLSATGGLVSYMRKVKAGATHKFSMTELVGELVTSSFAGMLTFYVCEWSGLHPLLTAAFVGISGHMGSRSLFLLEKWLQKKFPSPS